MPDTWRQLNLDILSCTRCPRLREYCARIGEEKRAAYRDQTYHARPVPNLGDATARLLLVGLAPAAHGGNRTGRMFTGDRSGDFLFAALHAAGFANQPTSQHRDDGLQLIDAAIAATAHCAPPDNKPTPWEILNCREYLDRTIDVLPDLRVIVVLGRIAFDAILGLYRRCGWLPATGPRPQFGHGVLHRFPNVPAVLCSYHPSQQNTFTGRLTPAMLLSVFQQARSLLA